ncbi:MAG: putative bifunctional diguanylate cyclase/phosphodiesterase, partial [Actinomycetota bacterium]
DIATFTGDDAKLLESLANQASTSLTNGLLIEQLREAVAANEHLAHHDPLTGLPNRVLFDLLVRRELSTGKRLAIMVMDLDRFKEVNDTLGHVTGDGLLRELGMRLTETAPGVIFSRLGGDEFAVLCPRDDEGDAGIETAAAVLEALKRPFAVGHLSLQVDASIGIALAPQHGEDPETLLRRADVARYHAKGSGIGVSLYAPELDNNTPRRLALVGELRLALERGELSLHYQPKVDLHSGRVSGVEALLRWRHPTHGPQLPEEFIPVAEQTGLIHPLTRWVIRRALEQCAEWEREGFTLGIAVNLSARNLTDPTLPDDIETILAEVGVPPSRLTLEITETAIMTDTARAHALLGRLSGLGIRLSVDDFGAGYTSLLYLKRLPLNEMKIDRSFVMSMASNPDDAAIVTYVVGLGTTLGLTVVAGGVEDAGALAEVQRLGADIAQGFGIARPLPAALTTKWLRAQDDQASSRSLRAV